MLTPSQKISIRIFSISSADVFEKNNIGHAIYWFMQKGDSPYLFREKTPSNFPAGSIALFNYESRIFGQAITSGDIHRFSFDERRQNEPYTASVRFLQSSIDVFCKYPSRTEVEGILEKPFGRAFTTVNTWEQYQRILKLAGRKP